VVYAGKVNYKGALYDGEQERIIDDDTWNKVQERLNRNGRRGGRNVSNKYGALLKSLVRCGNCDAGMTHSYVSKNKKTLYRYYVCINAHQRGWNKCETRSVSAPVLVERSCSNCGGSPGPFEAEGPRFSSYQPGGGSPMRQARRDEAAAIGDGIILAAC
jgi:hypothetical protein